MHRHPTTLGLALLLGALALPVRAQDRASPAATGDDAVWQLLLDAEHPPSLDRTRLLERIEGSLPLAVAAPYRGALEEILVARWAALTEERGEERTQALEALLAKDGVSGLGRLALQRQLRVNLRRHGRFAEARELMAAEGWVRRCQAVGPFGDEGSFFHDVRYAPEKGVRDLGERYAGRFGQVTWRALASGADATELDLTRGLAENRTEGCHYALVQVLSPDVRAVALDLSCSGSFELFHGRRRVGSVRRGIDPAPVRDLFPVTLAKGWNHVLVKLTHTSSKTFALRILDAAGRVMPDLEVEDELRLHEPAPLPEALPPVRLDLDDHVEVLQAGEGWQRVDKVSAGETSVHEAAPAFLAFYGEEAARDNHTDLGLALCRAARDRAPRDPGVLSALVATLQLARHVPFDMRRLELRDVLAAAGDLCDSHAWLFAARVDRLFADDKREEALKLVEHALEKQPEDLVLLDLCWTLLGRMDWDEEREVVLDRILKVRPDSTRHVLAKAGLEEGRGDLRGARARLEHQLEEHPGEREVLSRALRLARRMGDFEARSRLLELLNRGDPDSVSTLRARAELLADQRQFAEAAAELGKALAEEADNPALLEERGDQLYLAGEEQAALADYEKALALDPEDHDLRRLVLRLKGVGDEFPEGAPWRLDAMPLVREYAERPEDKISSSTLVLDQMILRVERDGSMLEETHQLRRINDRNGVEAFEQADRVARADEILEVRTIHADGETFVPHLVSGTFSMPKLEPGCFVEERYRNFKGARGARPIDFLSFYFRSADEPYRMSQLVVLLPKGNDLGEFVLRNFPDDAVERRDAGDYEAWVFTQRDMPRLVSERQMPENEELVPWLTFGKPRALPPYLRQAREVFDSITYPWLEIRQKTAEVVHGVEGDLAKARAIRDFVHGLAPDPQLRPGSPQAVSVLLKGEGDRFALQLAMLRAAGVRWRPALLDPTPPDLDVAPEPAFESPGRWSTRMALVEPADGEPFWIMQGELRWWPMGLIPPRRPGGLPLRGARYLLLEGEYGFPGVLAGPSLDDCMDYKVEADLKLEDGKAVMTADVRFVGPAACLLEEDIKDRPKNIQQLFATQNIARREFRGFAPRSHSYVGLDGKGGGFTVHFELERREAVQQREEGVALLPVLPPSMLTSAFGGRTEREHDFVFKGFVVRD
ncbi:MAG: hypothetical protein R3F30_10575 [Planctomycetota bacterium]